MPDGARYELIETSGGGFSIVEVRQTEVAFFNERSLAEVAVQALNFLKTGPAKDEPPREPSAPPVQTDERGAGEAEEWTEDELTMAFGRLQSGEKLRDVADGFGKSFDTLRGKWAAFRRYEPKTIRPAEPPSTASRKETPPPKASREPAEVDEDDLEECRFCGKHFRPTPERMDLCAKCERDL